MSRATAIVAVAIVEVSTIAAAGIVLATGLIVFGRSVEWLQCWLEARAER